MLGRGAFGTVTLARSRLDGRLVAVKRIPFRSAVPPWAPQQQLEAAHAPLLREVRPLLPSSAAHAHLQRAQTPAHAQPPI